MSMSVMSVAEQHPVSYRQAKCHFVATDIFTGKKLEDLQPSSHNSEVCCVGLCDRTLSTRLVQCTFRILRRSLGSQVPNVSRQEFTVIDISEDGFVRTILLSTYPRDGAFGAQAPVQSHH